MRVGLAGQLVQIDLLDRIEHILPGSIHAIHPSRSRWAIPLRR